MTHAEKLSAIHRCNYGSGGNLSEANECFHVQTACWISIITHCTTWESGCSQDGHPTRRRATPAHRKAQIQPLPQVSQSLAEGKGEERGSTSALFSSGPELRNKWNNQPKDIQKVCGRARKWTQLFPGEIQSFQRRTVVYSCSFAWANKEHFLSNAVQGLSLASRYSFSQHISFTIVFFNRL